MRLASMKRDYWELRSGVEWHRKHPETFWIPSEDLRNNVQVGNAVKVIADIETIDEEDSNIVTTGERVWLIVSEVLQDGFIGILDNQPSCTDPDSGFCLKFGVEVPLQVDHIIDIAQPPQDYVDWQLNQPPENEWPRDN